MKLLKEIYDKPILKNKKADKRSAVRAVLFDQRGLVPILFVSKLSYHKIPGGGIEENENKKTALAREILEETGSTAKIDREIGKIVEYRSRWNLLQTSYCYLGKVMEKGELSFTEEEQKEGFELVWVTLTRALSLLKNDKPSDYEGKFIIERDLRFLQEADLISKLNS
jgi:8-oxo-dGTP diphosphatase